MKKCLLVILMLSGMTVAAGCATKVQKDYVQYLANNTNQLRSAKVDRPFGYSLSPATLQHSTTIRSGLAGVLNTWEVRFGDFLQATLDSSDMRNIISLHPVQPNDVYKIYFDLVQYEFANTRASVLLRIETMLANGTKLSKVYSGKGNLQTAKMIMLGDWAMKNAMQQSSKHAIDQIFREYLADLHKALASPDK